MHSINTICAKCLIESVRISILLFEKYKMCTSSVTKQEVGRKVTGNVENHMQHMHSADYCYYFSVTDYYSKDYIK